MHLSSLHCLVKMGMPVQSSLCTLYSSLHFEIATKGDRSVVVDFCSQRESRRSLSVNARLNLILKPQSATGYALRYVYSKIKIMILNIKLRYDINMDELISYKSSQLYLLIS